MPEAKDPWENAAPEIMRMATERSLKVHFSPKVLKLHEKWRRFMLQQIERIPYFDYERARSPDIQQLLVEAGRRADALVRLRFPEIDAPKFTARSGVHGLSKLAGDVEFQLCYLVNELPHCDLSFKQRLPTVADFLVLPLSQVLAARFILANNTGIHIPATRQIFLNEKLCSEDPIYLTKTAVHEIIHYYTHEKFLAKYRTVSRSEYTRINEGFTEYFTQKVIARYPAYKEYVADVKAGYKHVSIRDKARAFFQGEVELLAKRRS